MKSKKRKITISITVFFIFTMINIQAQDINFLQSYNFREFINPSLLAFDECNSLYINDREISIRYGGINIAQIGFSGYYPQMHSGISLYLERQHHSNNIINTMTGGFSYVYKIKISRNWNVVPSISLYYYQRTYNFQNIIFPSMLGKFNNLLPLNHISLPNRNFNSLGMDFSLSMKMSRHLHFGIRYNNLVNYSLSNNKTTSNKSFSILAMYDFFSGRRKKYSSIIIVKKTKQNIEANFNVIYNITDKISVGLDVNSFNAQATICAFTGIYKIGHVDMAFSYGTNFPAGILSVYELGMKYEMRCKKTRLKTIKCPAYQF